VKEIKVTPVSTDFQVKVNKVGEGEFKIEVQPRDTTRPVAATFAIQPDNSPKAFYLSARVINSPPPVTTAIKP
jgi:5-enolpyruvylshikimate-3-phosphate synthase